MSSFGSYLDALNSLKAATMVSANPVQEQGALGSRGSMGMQGPRGSGNSRSTPQTLPLQGVTPWAQGGQLPGQVRVSSGQAGGYDPTNPFVHYGDPGGQIIQQRAPAASGVSADLGGALASMHGLGENDTRIINDMMKLDPTGKTALRYAQHASGQAANPEKSRLEEAQAGKVFQETAQNWSDLNAKGEGEKNYATDQRREEAKEHNRIGSSEVLGRLNTSREEHGLQPVTQLPEAGWPGTATPGNVPYGRGDQSIAGQNELSRIQMRAQLPLPPTAGAVIPANIQAQYHAAYGGDHEAAQRAAEAAGWR